MDDNPWLVDSIHSFSFFKCPECIFDSKEEENFHDHAIQNHPLSFVFFGKPGVEMITEEKSTDFPEKIEVLENSFEFEDNESSFEMEEYNENSFEAKYNEDSFEDTEMKTDVKKEIFEGFDAYDKVGIDCIKSQDLNHSAIKSKTFSIKTEYKAEGKKEQSNEPEKLNTDIIDDTNLNSREKSKKPKTDREVFAPIQKYFKSTTKDGKLNHCQELTPDGKKFAVWIIHLLESQVVFSY